MMTTKPPRGFVPELDGLRGLAILLVMTHRLWPRAGDLAAYNGIAEVGWIGVDLFFVISGFLICGILLDTRDEPDALRNFYARRVLRIFPLFYLFVGTMLVTFPQLTGASYLKQAGSPLWYLLQLGNIPEGVLHRDPPYWLAPVWSLAIEEQFYLSFPWLVRALDRRRLAQALVGFIVLAPIVRIAGLVLFPQLDRFQYEFTLCRLDTIAMGCLLAVIVRLPAERQPRSGVLATIALATATVAVVTGLDRTTAFGRTGGYTVVALGFASVVLLVVRARGGAAVAALRFAPLRYLGKICFGLYLLHRPADTIVGALAHRAGIDANAGVLIPLKMAGAIGLATMSWLLLERPFLRLKDRFVSRRHPLVTETASLVAAR
jgi:peptidoglycan/LPS O-acetylase OafA/YrhL